MKWIDVRVEKPKLGQRVIMTTRYWGQSHGLTPVVMGGVFSDIVSADGDFCSVDEGTTYPDVRYWIPYPERALHLCKNGTLTCQEDESGIFWLYGAFYKRNVSYCPFCGERCGSELVEAGGTGSVKISSGG